MNKRLQILRNSMRSLFCILYKLIERISDENNQISDKSNNCIESLMTIKNGMNKKIIISE